MIYHKNHEQLLADILSPERDAAAYARLLYDDSVGAHFNDVVQQGGGEEADLLQKKAHFIDFIFDFTFQRTERVKAEGAKTYEALIRFFARQFWAESLLLDPDKVKRVSETLRSHDQVRQRIKRKIKEPEDDYNLDLLVHDSIEILKTYMTDGRYSGKNVFAFLATTAYNLRRNERRKETGKNSSRIFESLTAAGHLSNPDYNPLEEALFREVTDKLYEVFLRLSETCQRVLYECILTPVPEKMPQKVLAKKLGYTSTQSLTNKLSDCRETWRDGFKDNSPKK